MVRPARLGGSGGWERAAGAVPARLSAQEHAAKNASLHFALRSLFYLFRLRRRGARAGSAWAPGDGSYFFAIVALQLPIFALR